MLRSLMRAAGAVLLLALCGWFAQAQPPNPTAKVQPPIPGPVAGSVIVPCSWADCTGLDSLFVIVAIKGPDGKEKNGKNVELKAPPPLNPTGNWSPTVQGLTKGDKIHTVIFSVYPPVQVGGGPVKALATDAKATNYIVP